MILYEALYKEVEAVLSPKRFKHSERVVSRALEYANCDYAKNVSKESVALAAIAHDMAKELSKEQAYEIIKKYNIKLDPVEEQSFSLIHGKLAAAIAKNKYGLSPDICSSIEYHTTGKPNMTILEKIIYLADATEPRTYIFIGRK